ncbi:MAG: hypothetical protein H7222_16515 [Methylotenera sp.]|nr:hypothetical protein [Oligoflexia bacterium]
MRLRNFVFIFLGLTLSLSLNWGGQQSVAAAQDTDYLNLYQSGKFEDALRVLEPQADAKKNDAAYHYNLGSIYLQLNRPSQAVIQLEWAHHLKPTDRDITKNRDLAREALAKVLGETHVDPASNPVERLDESFPLRQAAAALALLAGFLTLWTVLRNQPKSDPAFILGCAFLLVSLFAGIGHYAATRHPGAWVQVADVIRSGPGSQFLELSRVEPGVKLRVSDSEPRENPNPKAGEKPGEELWMQVRFSEPKETEGIGWIKVSSLLLL